MIYILRGIAGPLRDTCCWCEGHVPALSPVMIVRRQTVVWSGLYSGHSLADHEFHVGCYNAMMELYQRWKEARKEVDFTANYTVVDEGPVENGFGTPKGALAVGKDILRAHDL